MVEKSSTDDLTKVTIHNPRAFLNFLFHIHQMLSLTYPTDFDSSTYPSAKLTYPLPLHSLPSPVLPQRWTTSIPTISSQQSHTRNTKPPEPPPLPKQIFQHASTTPFQLISSSLPLSFFFLPSKTLTQPNNSTSISSQRIKQNTQSSNL